MPAKSLSGRACARDAIRDRRAQKRERRRQLLDLVVAGYAYEQIADRHNMSVAALRREVDRALADRAPQPVERYVAVQLARLQKAMLVVDIAMDQADLRAIPALAALNGEFDRYHGLAGLFGLLAGSARPRARQKTPKALESPGISTESANYPLGNASPIAR